MSISNDAGHYFQTTTDLATTERKAAKSKNKFGEPIAFPSKILAVIKDNLVDNVLYVAEAAGEVKKIDLDTNKITKIFSEGVPPLTCLTVCSISRTLFAGSWDKRIYAIDLNSTRKKARHITGHADFVKCLLATSLNGKPTLVSGGADSTIIVWDSATGKSLHKLKGHTKAVQDLAIDPLSLPGEGEAPGDSFVLFSASSDREIRRWHISLDSAHELAESVERPILGHETSVYRLCFDSEGDLWTASADKTAKHLVRSRDWEADTTLQHPDFVRDVVVQERLGLVITACRDEEVRVWDVASGECRCVFSGHYEEVTGLVVVGALVVSVCIDGTLRRWGLAQVDMEKYGEEVRKVVDGEKGDDDNTGAGRAGGGSKLTAEEEAELAELMDEDD